jgi:hypothetical protein
MFILPCSIIRRIESILAAFLWKDCSLSHSEAKIAWASACYPLNKSGLEIKSDKTWNKIVILKHFFRLLLDIFRLLLDRSSIWSGWVRSVLLKGRSFWYVRSPSIKALRLGTK